MPRTPPLERFWPKIDEDSNGCWRWTSVVLPNGYGRFWDGERQVYAHRFAYEFFVGPIPDGLQIDHLCRVRNCVNPAHLEPVTCRENLARGDVWSLPRRSTNAEKTHCPQGHSYEGANLYVKPHGGRECRTCLKLAQRRRRANLKLSEASNAQAA